MSDAPTPDDESSPEDEYPPITNDVKNWAMLCHLAALLSLGMPVIHIAGPFVVWMLKRDEHPFIDDNGKESINFQLSILIYTLLIIPLLCILIGIPLLLLLLVANVVLVVVAAVKAGSGQMYQYPLTIRFIK